MQKQRKQKKKQINENLTQNLRLFSAFYLAMPEFNQESRSHDPSVVHRSVPFVCRMEKIGENSFFLVVSDALEGKSVETACC